MAEVTVSRNEDEARFEAFNDDQLLGYIEYDVDDGIIDLPHTKVFPEFEGQGVASSLTRQALDMIREIGDLKVKPTCPYTEVWIKRHSDYQDLLAEG